MHQRAIENIYLKVVLHLRYSKWKTYIYSIQQGFPYSQKTESFKAKCYNAVNYISRCISKLLLNWLDILQRFSKPLFKTIINLEQGDTTTITITYISNQKIYLLRHFGLQHDSGLWSSSWQFFSSHGVLASCVLSHWNRPLVILATQIQI